LAGASITEDRSIREEHTNLLIFILQWQPSLGNDPKTCFKPECFHARFGEEQKFIRNKMGKDGWELSVITGET
jgi:hypothetical protein